MRKKIRSQCWKQAQAQVSISRVSCAPGDGAYLVDVTEHKAGAFRDLFAYGRQHDFPGRTLDELHAQLIFEFPDLCAERRLADKTGFGCFTEMPEVRKFYEVLERPEIHGAII